ncbi:MAG: PEP-CTERM sorting domain-containing protein [Verrucomicrobia bacterium]|nr:PEP-CTERM sorting domain-containing protein [Verrucomicrobiota bacterium]
MKLPFTNVLKLTLLSGLISVSWTQAATVNFDSGGGEDLVVFATTGGNEAVGATMFAGTFNSAPSIGSTSLEDVLNDFLTFDEYGTTSGSPGSFNAGSFEGNVTPTFSSGKIYLVVVNASTIAAATEFAVFSSTDGSWTFPGNDTTAPPSGITLAGTVDQYYAGTPGTFQNPGGAPFDADSIQFAAIPEPSSLLLLVLGCLATLYRRR